MSTGKPANARSRSGNSFACIRNSKCQPSGATRRASFFSMSMGSVPGLRSFTSTMLTRTPRTPAASSFFSSASEMSSATTATPRKRSPAAFIASSITVLSVP
jgi:hypothetical protein